MSNVAETILQQLGGQRFVVMTGAKHFMSDTHGAGSLTMKLPRQLTRNHISHVRIILDRDDTYRLEALKVSDRDVYDSVAAALGGQVVGYAHRGESRDPLEISVRLPQSARSWGEGLAAMPVAVSQDAGGGRLVSLGGLLKRS